MNEAHYLYSFPKIWEEFPSEQIKIYHKISEFDHNPKQFLRRPLRDGYLQQAGLPGLYCRPLK